MNSLSIFFDIGGTLLDAPDLFNTIANELNDKEPNEKTRDLFSKVFFKLYKNPEDPTRFLNIEGMIAATLESLAKNYGYSDISNRAHDIYFNVFLNQSSLFPETLYVLGTLLNRNVKMIIASDTDTRIMEEQLVKHNLNQYFVDKCTSELVRAYKPSDRFVNYLHRYTSGNEDKCYFVGDSPADIECGNVLGIKSILVDRQSKRNIADLDYIVQDLSGILHILGLE